MKYCPFCGSGLRDEMAFCPQCGKRFHAGEYNPEADALEMYEDNSLPIGVEIPESKTKSECQSAILSKRTAVSFPKKRHIRPPFIILLCILSSLLVVVAILLNANRTVMDMGNAMKSVLYLEVYDDHGTLTTTASGFIVGDGSAIVTNYHVVEHAYRIIAYTHDGEIYAHIHEMTSCDKNADLAVLNCDKNTGGQALIIAQNSDDVKQGDDITVIGYPLGIANTISNGIVSSRYFDKNDIDTLQITAPISSGSSGSPVFNKRGEVIGIVAASYVDGQNLNVAIASNQLLELSFHGEPQDLEDIYTPMPLNEDIYFETTIDELFFSPRTYDGALVKVTGIIPYSGRSYDGLVYGADPGEAIFLMIPQGYRVKSVEEAALTIQERLDFMRLSDSPSYLTKYYSTFIKPKGIPVVVVINNSKGEIPLIGTCVTVYGKFSYNSISSEYPLEYQFNLHHIQVYS